jgi:hypothetical protein
MAGSSQRGFPIKATISPAKVVDSAGVQVGLWFPDIPGDDEYLVHTIGSITFIAEVRNTGIKGGAGNLYYASSDCSGSPFIEEVPGEDFDGDLQRLTIPYQETFSLLNMDTGAGTSPLYYADSTDHRVMTVCAYKGPDGDCSPATSGGCETIAVYPALTWDWSRYVLPFLFK